MKNILVLLFVEILLACSLQSNWEDFRTENIVEKIGEVYEYSGFHSITWSFDKFQQKIENEIIEYIKILG